MTCNFSPFSHWRVNLMTTAFVLSFFILALSLTLISLESYNSDYSIIPVYARPQISPDGPTLNDPNLIVETVYQGLKSPTSMAFLGPNDILVLEKGQGTVQRIVNGKILPEPLIQLDVTSKDERGLLGIAIASNDEKTGKENQNKNNSIPISISILTLFYYYIVHPRSQ
jgi:aldose sugar dehydrogenase